MASSAFDFVGFMEEHLRIAGGARGHSDDRHRELKADCPFCGGSQKLWANRQTSKWTCYKCGLGGGAVHLVQRVLGLTWREAQKIVVGDGLLAAAPASEIVRKYLDVERRYTEGRAVDFDPEPVTTLPDEFIPCWDPATRTIRLPDYLRGRGIGVRLSSIYGLGYCLEGRYAGRVVCPATVGGVLRTFQARSMIGATPKYQNPPDNSRSKVFYGYDQALGAKTWIIVEGSFDTYGVARAGWAGAGTMGKRCTAFHGMALADAGVERAIFLYDPDAIADVLPSAQIISEWVPEVLHAHLPKEYDAGDAPSALIDERLRAAGPLKRFWKDSMAWGAKRRFPLDRVRDFRI